MTGAARLYQPFRCAAHARPRTGIMGARGFRGEASMVRPLIAFCIAVVVVAAAVPASADPVAAADARAVRGVVAAQLDAFAHDDAARAFSYAAPEIQAMFGTPERFVAMVRAGYPAVYRAAGATFLVAERRGDEIVQRVHVSDAAGAVWLATYRLERQRDGAWRIRGCDVERAPGRIV
jgi:hypothetical protein